MARSVEQLPQASSDELRTVPCVACGGTRVHLLLSADDVRREQRWLERFHASRIASDGDDVDAAKDRATFTQSDATNVVACAACGTVLRDPQPTCAMLGETYAEDEYGRATLERLAENQNGFFADRMARLAPVLALPGGARVLEIGSFVGGFLRAAAALGWRATGTDIGEETTRFLAEAGFDVRHGDVLRLPLAERSYDAVFVWNTFDQLCNPDDTVRRVAALLRPGGALVLRVPNGRFETACLALRRAARGTPREERVLRAQAYNNFVTFPYLAGYTPESLCGFLADRGFTCGSVAGDTILTLADDRTRPFAVAEEARYKRAVLRACRAAERTTRLLFHPWIDVIATLRTEA